MPGRSTAAGGPAQPDVRGAGGSHPARDPGSARQGEATVNELAAPFAMSLPAVSKHLKVLQRAGLITQRRQAQWRPCRLEAEPLRDVSDWVEQYRRFWEERFDRLDEYLLELKRREQEREQRRDEENADGVAVKR